MRPIDERAVHEALQWIGTPYAHQMSMRGQGTDCLGLVRGVWRQLYGAEPVEVPPYSPDWQEAGDGEALLQAATDWLLPVETPEIGQVLLFRMQAGAPPRHCGISVDEHSFVHAYWGRSVMKSRLGPWWQRRLAGRFSFPEAG